MYTCQASITSIRRSSQSSCGQEVRVFSPTIREEVETRSVCAEVRFDGDQDHAKEIYYRCTTSWSSKVVYPMHSLTCESVISEELEEATAPDAELATSLSDLPVEVGKVIVNVIKWTLLPRPTPLVDPSPKPHPSSGPFSQAPPL